MSGWDDLLSEAREGAALRRSIYHGERHWRAVAATGLALVEVEPRLDPAVLLAFGMTHDCRREDEGRDPYHGHRSAAFVRDSATVRDLLGEARQATLARACEIHNGSPAIDWAAEPTVAACLDADRLTLRRVGDEPSRRYLSLDWDMADLPRWIDRADAFTACPPDWSDLIAALAHLTGPAASAHPSPSATEAHR